MELLARKSLVWFYFKGTLQVISVLSFRNSAGSYYTDAIPSSVCFSKAGIGIIYSTRVQEQEIKEWLMIWAHHKKHGEKFCLGRQKSISLSCFAPKEYKASLRLPGPNAGFRQLGSHYLGLHISQVCKYKSITTYFMSISKNQIMSSVFPPFFLLFNHCCYHYQNVALLQQTSF